MFMFLLLMAVSTDRKSDRIMKWVNLFSLIRSKASCMAVASALKIEAVIFFFYFCLLAEHHTLLESFDSSV